MLKPSEIRPLPRRRTDEGRYGWIPTDFGCRSIDILAAVVRFRWTNEQSAVLMDGDLGRLKRLHVSVWLTSWHSAASGRPSAARKADRPLQCWVIRQSPTPANRDLPSTDSERTRANRVRA